MKQVTIEFDPNLPKNVGSAPGFVGNWMKIQMVIPTAEVMAFIEVWSANFRLSIVTIRDHV